MSAPYGTFRDTFDNNNKPDICAEPETCERDHIGEVDDDGNEHHYECECGFCMYLCWMLKN